MLAKSPFSNPTDSSSLSCPPNKGDEGVDAHLQALSKKTDQLLIERFHRQAELRDKTALIATGGYGRGELYPSSDIDLLILYQEPIDAGKLTGFLQNLWDEGYKIGHAVRSLSECREWSRTDISVQTALLESRYLAGDRHLAECLAEQMADTLQPQNFLLAKEKEQLTRHQRYQNIDSSLEPNIKESPGGLREWHLLRWMERAIHYHRDQMFHPPPMASRAYWQSWVHYQWILPEEAEAIIECEQFLRHLRWQLHQQISKNSDKLFFDIQPKLAQIMGYQASSSPADNALQVRAQDRLMKDYYHYAQQTLTLNRLLIDAIGEHRREHTKITKTLGFGLALREDQAIDLIDPDSLSKHPEWIFKPYLLLRQGVGAVAISSTLKRQLRLMARKLAQSEQVQIWRRRVREDFLALLKLPKGTITTLRELNRNGILGVYLPAFGQIVGLLQHDLYHAYTVDQHILMVIRNLRRFMLAEFAHEYPEQSAIMGQFRDPWRLIVAALFHDIAKGRGGNHSELGKGEAGRFCEEHGMNNDDRDLIVWLVENHLSMSRIAQHEDINDPQIVRAFAEKVATTERLTALYLLTVADIRGTSPKVWNQWKAKLLSELYHATQAKLTPSDALPTQEREPTKYQQVINSFHMVGIDEGAKWWRALHADYLHVFSAESIVWHFRIWLRHQQQHKLGKVPAGDLCIGTRVVGDFVEVVFMTERAQTLHLLSKSCGHLAHMGYSVMSAKMAPWLSSSALSPSEQHIAHLIVEPPPIIRSANTEGGAISRAQLSILSFSLRELLTSATDPLPLVTRISRQLKASAFRPEHRIVLDESGNRYIVSVASVDRLGLLYDLLRLFGQYHAEIRHARINTLGNRIENTFVLSAPALANPATMLLFEQSLEKVLAF